MYRIELNSNRVLERVASPNPSIRGMQDEGDVTASEGGETYMLLEDLRNGLFYRRGVDGGQIRPSLHSNSNNVRRDIAHGLSREPHASFAHAAQRFLQVCFGDLARHEIAIHEIAYERDRRNGQLESPDRFLLIRVDPRSVQQRWWGFGRLVQKASQEDRSEFGLPKYIPIQGDRFLIARLPDDLETPLQQALDGLRGTASHKVLSAFPPWERPSVRQSGAYSFEEHTATRRAVLAGATREIGWTGRNILSEDANSHYLVRRHIRFERYMAKLRRFLISHLNSALERVGITVGFDVEVELQNAPQPSDYDEAKRALEEGTKSFREIMSDIGR